MFRDATSCRKAAPLTHRSKGRRVRVEYTPVRRLRLSTSASRRKLSSICSMSGGPSPAAAAWSAALDAADPSPTLHARTHTHSQLVRCLHLHGTCSARRVLKGWWLVASGRNRLRETLPPHTPAPRTTAS
jgi:hypothetical protein